MENIVKVTALLDIGEQIDASLLLSRVLLALLSVGVLFNIASFTLLDHIEKDVAEMPNNYVPIFRKICMIDLVLISQLIGIIIKPYFISAEIAHIVAYECETFSYDNGVYISAILVTSGILVIIRQLLTLLREPLEGEVFQVNILRIYNLLKMILLLMLLFIMGLFAVSFFHISYDRLICFVPIWLAAGPVVLTGFFVITAIVQSAIEATRDNHAISIKECEAQLLNVSTSNGSNFLTSLKCRLHIISHVAASTWMTLFTSLALGGILFKLISVGNLCTLVGLLSFISGWNLFSITFYWT